MEDLKQASIKHGCIYIYDDMKILTSFKPNLNLINNLNKIILSVNNKQECCEIVSEGKNHNTIISYHPSTNIFKIYRVKLCRGDPKNFTIFSPIDDSFIECIEYFALQKNLVSQNYISVYKIYLFSIILLSLIILFYLFKI